MAIASERVTATAIDATEFPELARAYQVSGVPKIVINDRVELLGAYRSRSSSRRFCAAPPTRRRPVSTSSPTAPSCAATACMPRSRAARRSWAGAASPAGS